ncbi:hypothetical protein C9374_003583 [Naegleria lovaniensis]|uniref:Transmembrane protein n=1 Tax=Naegleria lovaniensis TaxID=51637 RepID=A0AA88KSM3_NAELO|nr:uncharacterized protein C9374_003583 [Naegleria lovaniensis]KAG2393819.1 hypothetical protein C9374_003583 [Naegleria lovaniensis]
MTIVLDRQRKKDLRTFERHIAHLYSDKLRVQRLWRFIYNLVLIVTIICFFLFYYYSYHYHASSVPLSRNSSPGGKHHIMMEQDPNDNISSQNIQPVEKNKLVHHDDDSTKHRSNYNENSNYVKFHPYKSDKSEAETDPAALEQQRKNNIVSAVGFFLLVFFLMVHFFTQQTRHLANDYVYGLNMSLYLFHIQFNPNTLKLIKLSPSSHAASHAAVSTVKTSQDMNQESTTASTMKSGTADMSHKDEEDSTQETPSSIKTLSFYSQGGDDDLNDIDVKRLNAFIDENRKQSSSGGFPSGKMILPPHLQRPENLEREIEIQESLERKQEQDMSLAVKELEQRAAESGYGMPMKPQNDMDVIPVEGGKALQHSQRLHHLYFHRERDDDEEESIQEKKNK